ncbi:MAG TPA: glycosyltransferase [Rhizomicrobium sp.]|jgi:processive 1,2-diacylglycerol beta-glucosyltransferase|nr:glycosyltransferase [Rhizomicrobium sp.]
MDIYDLLAPLDPLKRLSGYSSPEIYNTFVQKKGWSGLPWLAFAAFGKLWILSSQSKGVPILSRFISARNPALVISVIPLLNRTLLRAIRQCGLKARLLTVMLDLRECAKGIWLEDRNQTLFCFTSEARQQCLEFGIPADHVFQIGRPPIREQFFRPAAGAAVRAALRVPLSTHTGLMMFGAQGADRMYKYAKALFTQTDDFLLFACGQNDSLRKRAERDFPAERMRAFTFLDDIAPLYAASDYVVSKPGPSTIWEAAWMNRPLVLELNASTALQERFHAQWADRKGLAILFNNPSSLVQAVSAVKRPQWREEFEKRVLRVTTVDADELTNALRTLIMG